MTIFFNILGIAVFLILVIGIQKRPDFFFWLFLNLFFDPGGYVSGFLGGDIFGQVNIADIIIVCIVLCLISIKFKLKTIKSNQLFQKFLNIFLIYVIYYFLVYGYIAPYLHNDLDYSTFLLKNRNFVYGFIILISVYAFSLRGLKYFYTITLFFGVICLSLYWISLLTGIELSPIVQIERYSGSSMMRIAMSGYGYFNMLFPISLIVYIISRKAKLKLKYKKWLYYGGIMMVLTLLITLTRRTILEIIGTVLIIVFLVSYLTRSVRKTILLKIITAIVIAVLILHFTFPKYVNYVLRIGEDTFSLLLTGKDTRGLGEERVSGTGEYLAVKKSIRKNLWFGTGYTYLYWGETGYATSPRGYNYAQMADAAMEVPVYYLFFGFGLIGAILMLPLYIIMAKLFFKTIKLLKQNLFIYMENPLNIIFSIYVLLIIASKFTFKIWALGEDLWGHVFSSTAVWLGIGFALLTKLKKNKMEKYVEM